MRVSDFDFPLPPELIAQHPPAERGDSRMMTVSRATGDFADRHFRDFPSLLHPGDLLVLNNSRVIPARLFGRRAGLRTQSNSPAPTGQVEVLLTQPLGNNRWKALVKPGRKIPAGERLIFSEDNAASPHNLSSPPQRSEVEVPALSLSKGPASRSDKDLCAPSIREADGACPEHAEGWASRDSATLEATVLEAGDFGERTLQFDPTPDFFATLDRLGHMPLPPYIHREADVEEDRTRYQTVYAGADTHGSAAAPTAGLHFTPAILDQIRERGVEVQYITLHVGLGTFQPVRAEHLADIRLHEEHYTLPAATATALQKAKAEGRRIIAVGTTTTRTLEHCAETSHFAAHSGSTSIFLAPGHRFRLVSALLTNFHLPQSTLLMLVSALAAPPDNADEGRQRILRAYAHAVQQHYRFFSYGDCMFLS